MIGCSPLAVAQQVQVTTDVLPDTKSTDSTAVLNNTLRQNANAINSIGRYFNSNLYLTEANGGTGANLSTVPNGSILVQNTANVGIGTFGQGSSGQFLVSAGANVVPVWKTASTQIFTSSGSFTAAADVTKIYLSIVGAGGGGGGNASTVNGGGGGGGGAGLINYPYTVVPGNSYTVTINAGGAGGDGSGSAATDGGTTVFDAITIAGGIKGLTATAGGTGGVGGGGLSGSGQTAGIGGVSGGTGGTRTGTVGGGGGGSALGAGSTGGANAANASSAAANTGGGGGGGGGGGNNTSGGNGGSGIVIVMY